MALANQKETPPNKGEVSQNNNTDMVSAPGAVVKQTADIDGFILKRQEFIKKVSAICVEGKDYHIIQGKKSLAKGGAEKIASIFQWNASFDRDDDALEMLGKIDGLVAFKCTVRKGTKYVGEGRGAANLSNNGNDANKTLKMAQKSAFIDAVLRSSGLSDFFTQDLEDMKPSDIGKPQQAYQAPGHKPGVMNVTFQKPTTAQLGLIQKLKEQKGYSSKAIAEAVQFNPGQDLSKHVASLIIEWLIKAPNLLEGETAEIPFN